MSDTVRELRTFLRQLRAEFSDFREVHGRIVSAYLALIITAHGRYSLEIPKEAEDGSSLRKSIIGGGNGVSAVIWQLQLSSAPSYAGEPVHVHGVEVGTKPVHQHCTAEGYR